MIYLVTGGSGSGKSAYAEDIILQSGEGKRYYIATMEVFGREEKKKVERHQKLREGKGMTTVECPRKLFDLRLEDGKKSVLLECMANLAANELFGCACADFEEDTGESRILCRAKMAAARIKEGILRLEEQCGLLVVVSSEVFSDGIDYGEETNAYIWLLGEINCWLAKRAKSVVEVVCGIGCVKK